LAIVKAIVEAHEGSVSVENRLPKGARVSITLPA
jgi:signal transduction histidine kinase